MEHRWPQEIFCLFVAHTKKKYLALFLNQEAPGMCIQMISLQHSILLLWHSFHLYMLAGSPLVIKYLMYFYSDGIVCIKGLVYLKMQSGALGLISLLTAIFTIFFF